MTDRILAGVRVHRRGHGWALAPVVRSNRKKNGVGVATRSLELRSRRAGWN